jgi:hypothetical protein
MFIVTDAPQAYDGFGTRTVRVVGTTRHGDVRQVETPDEHARWQECRYCSGGVYIVANEAQWADLAPFLLKIGDLKPV